MLKHILFSNIIIAIIALKSFATEEQLPTKSALYNNTTKRLDAAWETLIDGLYRAKDTLEKPQHFPPEASDRVLAEGYRYLFAHLNRAIEFEFRADPLFPEFFRSMDMLRKWTGENPDAMYLKAPIDGKGFIGSQAKLPTPKSGKRLSEA